jgi:hypothetical protein
VVLLVEDKLSGAEMDVHLFGSKLFNFPTLARPTFFQSVGQQQHSKLSSASIIADNFPPLSDLSHVIIETVCAFQSVRMFGNTCWDGENTTIAAPSSHHHHHPEKQYCVSFYCYIHARRASERAYGLHLRPSLSFLVCTYECLSMFYYDIT